MGLILLAAFAFALFDPGLRTWLPGRVDEIFRFSPDPKWGPELFLEKAWSESKTDYYPDMLADSASEHFYATVYKVLRRQGDKAELLNLPWAPTRAFAMGADRIYCSDSQSNVVTVIDRKTMALRQPLIIKAAQRLLGLALHPREDKLVAVEFNGSSLYLVDLTTKAQRTLPGFGNASTWAYDLRSYGGMLYANDVPAGLVYRIEPGRRPEAILRDPRVLKENYRLCILNEKLYLPDLTKGVILVFDLKGSAQGYIRFPHLQCVSPGADGQLLIQWVGHSGSFKPL